MKKFGIDKFLTFTVLVFLFTLTGAFMPLSGDTYLHIGDSVIYIAAVLLPTPLACAVSAVGAALADIVLGHAIYAVPTLVIKVLTVLFAKAVIKAAKGREISDILVCLSGVVTIIGYFLARFFITVIGGNTVSDAFLWSAEGMLYDLLQALACAAVYMFTVNFARKLYNKKGQPTDTDDKSNT